MMAYFTFDDYIEIGGKLDLAAFNRHIDRACAMVDIRTHQRLSQFAEIPKIVQIVLTDLLDYISANTVEKPNVSSRSQSAGGVSESESYSVKTADDFIADLDRIFEPLQTVKTPSGISLTYRGAME